MDWSFLGWDGCAPVAFVMLAVAAAIVVGLILLPLLIFVGELLLLALLAYALGRWWVVAETTGPPRQTRAWRVRGAVSAQRFVNEVATSPQTSGILPFAPRDHR